MILKCEGRTKPVEVNPQEVHDILYQDIFEKKLRMAMSEKFDEIRDEGPDRQLPGRHVAVARPREAGRDRRGNAARRRSRAAERPARRTR